MGHLDQLYSAVDACKVERQGLVLLRRLGYSVSNMSSRQHHHAHPHASGTIVAYFIMPETMRRSPAEIQEMFVDRVPLRRWKGYKTSVERDLEAREAVQEI